MLSPTDEAADSSSSSTEPHLTVSHPTEPTSILPQPTVSHPTALDPTAVSFSTPELHPTTVPRRRALLRRIIAPFARSIPASRVPPPTVSPPSETAPTVPLDTASRPNAAFKVYVGNVPPYMYTGDLFKIFSDAGVIYNFFHSRRDTRGYIFSFTHPGAAEKAVEMFNGREGMIVCLAH